ncbi:hypothetical protein [Flexivirga alba]|uniref:Uncharacterized protein n=1 Tax=Flexivirga alba TaxID=702742 RepID=A0ABW2AMX2_9MICO
MVGERRLPEIGYGEGRQPQLSTCPVGQILREFPHQPCVFVCRVRGQLLPPSDHPAQFGRDVVHRHSVWRCATARFGDGAGRV